MRIRARIRGGVADVDVLVAVVDMQLRISGFRVGQ